MIVCKTCKIRSIVFGIVVLFISLLANLSVDAEETISIYNRNEEVILSHEPVYYKEQYFIHFDDLPKLGLDITKEEADDSLDNTFDYTIDTSTGKVEIKEPSDFQLAETSESNSAGYYSFGYFKERYTITATDYLGKEKQIIIDDPVSSGGYIVTDPETGEMMLVTPQISEVRYTGSVSERYTKKIGESYIINTSPDIIFKGQFGDLIRINDEYYISTEIIGNRLSHKYSFENGRMDFYIANTDSVIMKTTINASSVGNDVKIYTAYKTSEGNTLDNFEILSSVSSAIPKDGKLTCEIETPAEKIGDKNIYFIADLGERYDFIYKEYDFSKVGNVLVYVQPKDCTYTVNITMPEIEEIDIPFTVYVKTDNGTFSKRGVVKSGEEFCKFEFEGLPGSIDIKTWIEFDYHKYQNAVLEEFMRVRKSTADFDTDFTPKYSDKVICNVSLPDDFTPEGDVEVKLYLSKYRNKGSFVIADDLRDWGYNQTVILNNEKRSEQVILYWQSSSTKLSYSVRSGGNGLCESGYFGYNGETVSNDTFSMEIEEEMTVDFTLLKQKSVTISVCRPNYDTDKDIFGKVILDDKSTSVYGDIVKNFTQTPLIPAGEFSSQFDVVIPEDVVYTLEITEITGDEDVFGYCCLAKPYSSSASGSNKRILAYSSNYVALSLLGCNTVTGTIECEDMNLDFEVFAICNLYNDDPITQIAEVENGEIVLKIPDDTDTYTFGVQTKIGKKSYYVSDGVSTNNQDEATEISFRSEEDKEVVLKYIVQKPSISVEYNKRNKNFVFKNDSDYLIENIDLYLSYYGRKGNIISVERKEVPNLKGGESVNFLWNAPDYKIVKVKAFAWERNSLMPLADTVEISVNTPSESEKDMSVFKNVDIKAIINCEEVVLSEAPKVVDDVLYVPHIDLEKLGYKVETSGNERYVYIGNGELEYRFTVGEYTVRRYYPDGFYEVLEISAPVVDDNGIKVPLKVVLELDEERFNWYSDIGTIVVNLPFNDIGECGEYVEAVLAMYYKGVVHGVESDSGEWYIKPQQNMLRCEAAACFTTAMGYEFYDYEFECDDIASTNWAKSFVGICVNENVFELEDNKFRPLDYITVEETLIAAIKMIGEDADNYLQTAKETGIITNIKEENIQRNITKAELLQILYNALKLYD